MAEGVGNRNRRRFSRYSCAVSAVLPEQHYPSPLVTADVSRHGAFLLTDDPRPERELLRLNFDLPDHDPLEVLGTVAHRVLPTVGCTAELEQLRVPGMGVDFLALSRAAKDIWDEFVFGLRERPGAGVSLERTSRSAPIRRRYVRHLSCFLVRLRDKDRLRELYTRDIGAGGMLLQTPVPEPSSAEIELIVVHPESEQEFHLWGRVRPRGGAPESAAEREASAADAGTVAIEFERLGTAREAALLAFIETGVNYLDHTMPADDHQQLIEEAARSAPNSADALVTLGQSMLEAADAQLAVSAFRSALTIDACCPEAHRGLYQAYTDLDQPEDAADHLRQYEQLALVPSSAGADEGPGRS